MIPQHVNPVQWQQNIGLARQACARIFRDGGTPMDALKAFHLGAGEPTITWNTVVDRITASLSSTTAVRKAA